PIANGGTGASNASAARTNLGLGSAATNNTSDFIANGTSQQASANFNISGSGQVGTTLTAGGAINAGSVYQIGGISVLQTPNGGINTFVGQDAGTSNAGSYGTFVGSQAGHSSNIGDYNTFMGRASGYNNSTGHENTYIGTISGNAN